MIRRLSTCRIGILVSLLACKGDDRKPVPVVVAAPDQGSASRIAVPAPLTTGLTQAIEADLGHLGADSEFVMGIDVDQLRTSTVWRLAYGRAVAKEHPELARIATACGFDPLATIKSLTMASRGSGVHRTIEAVLHGPERSALRACLDKLLADAKTFPTISKDGEVFVAQLDPTEALAMTSVDDRTVHLVAPKSSKAAFEKMESHDSALPSARVFRELIGTLTTSDTVWFVANASSPALAAFSPPTTTLKAVFGTVRLADDMHADVRFRLQSPDQAVTFATFLKSSLGNVTNVFDQFSVEAIGVDAKVTIFMSREKLAQLAAQSDGKAELELPLP